MSSVPAWLDSLVEGVAGAMTSHGVPGPVGFRYRDDDGMWEVIVYALPVEMVGGANDGGVVSPGFSLDLEGLRSSFSRVDDVTWNSEALGPADDDGPCVSIEGQFQGHEVWLRVLAYAPDDEEPGLKFDITKGN
jgi:hypothetical protein